MFNRDAIIDAKESASVEIETSEASNARAGSSSLLGGFWVKRSSEDLSDVLVNFKQINESLAAHEECRCFYQQLNEKGFKIFKQSCSEVNNLEDCFRKVSGEQ